MKKIFKRVLVSLLMIVGLTLCSTKVNAQIATLNMTQTDWWWSRYQYGNYYSWHVSLYDFNGRTAYCIQPLIEEGTTYTIGGWDNIPYNDATKEKLTLIAYYGYDYPGHNTFRYRVATQALLWENTTASNVKFNSARYDAGTVYDVSQERNEIMRLVNTHYVKPSFSGQKIKLDLGDSITLNDTNKVLSDYNVSTNENAKVSINGNSMTITATGIGNIDIKLTKKQYTNAPYLSYYGDGIQTMISAGSLNEVSTSFNVEVKGGKLEILKTGEEVEYKYGNYKYKDLNLGGAIFNIYAEEDIKSPDGRIIFNKDEIIGTMTSDENGYASFDNLYFGKYYIQEVEAPEGYVLDENKYSFNITKLNGEIQNVNLNLKNYLERGNLDFTKSDFSTGNSLPNCKIEIYKIDGILIFTGITDDLGTIKIDDLPIGSYYLLEKEAPEGYMLNPNKMYFSITENGEIIKATLTDELIIHDVPSTDKNEFPIIETISMVICLIGFGVIMYVKKKK